MANIFLSYHEENLLNKCPIEFKPSFYRSYVDIFVHFESPQSSHYFRKYMSSKHQNITFTIEQETLASFRFETSKVVAKPVNLSLVFTGDLSLGFSPIMKISFQRTKREEFYTHYFMGVSVNVVIS